MAVSLLCLCGCLKKPVRVAVIDSGVSNVSAYVLPGHNYIDNSDDTTDTQGHGSMLAEIIVSYAPDCYIIPLKVSYEDPAVSDFVIQAIQDCIDQYEADIIFRRQMKRGSSWYRQPVIQETENRSFIRQGMKK